jgi:hypothetical protein
VVPITTGSEGHYDFVFVLQSAPPPTLGITTVSNMPVVVWPASATNYVLQMTTNLASGNWVTVTNGIPFIGLQVTNAPGTAFFRLLLQSAPPTLGITTVSSMPVIVWPASATNYVLQMTTNLASGNWVTVTNGIPFIGLQVTNAPGTAFFRLH